MSYQDSPFSTMYGQDDYDIDEDNDEYLEDDRDVEEQDESDEGIIIYYNIIIYLYYFIKNFICRYLYIYSI